MEEQKLTEQVLQPEEAKSITEEDLKVGDNLAMADGILDGLIGPFQQSLLKLSNNKLRRVITTLIRFPFIDDKVKLRTQEEKVAFMFGERLIYANMVKRARMELERTFGEVAKEEQNSVGSTEIGDSDNVRESQTKSSEVNPSGEAAISGGINETPGNSQV